MSESTTATRPAVHRPSPPSPEIDRIGAGATTAAPSNPEPPKRDAMADLLDKFERIAGTLGSREPGIAAGLNRLVEQGAEPGRTEQPLFRTQVAYMLQDVEKLAGAKITSVPAELRAELTKLAGTSPGLENKQMEALVSGTADVADRGVIRDIRRNAATIAGLDDQQSSQAREIVEVLENRLRLATRFSSPETPSQASAPTPGAKSDAPPNVSRPSTLTDSPGSEKVRIAQSPGDNSPVSPNPIPKPDRPIRTNDSASGIGGSSQIVSPPKSLMSSIMDNLRAPSGPTLPWEPPPSSMKDRVSGFEQKLAEGRTDQHIRAAEKSGQVLMQSMETFVNGPGAGVLGKIEAAASSEPGGMRAVMSEMQPGGRYANLRSEFDNALQQDRAFSASFNAVEKAAVQYGHDRLTLGADFQARKLDASQLDARFDRADAAIAAAAEKVPGRTPGQSIMTEMAEKIGELLNQAADRVRQLFSREPEAGPKQSSSPGMAP